LNNEIQDLLSLVDFEGQKCILYRRALGPIRNKRNALSENDFGWWELPRNRARTADYLVVIENNRIIEVRDVTEWLESSAKVGRLKCMSEPSDNLKHLLGKSVLGIYNSRDRTILRFVNC
jgi:hypothetical protein